MVFKLARRQRPEPAAASVPRGLRVYAIGDIHGRLDLLDRLLALIEEDGAGAPDLVKYIVTLGDYVDRGPASAGVIDRLIAGPPVGFGAIHLKGNHEAAMLDFLTDTRVGPSWLSFGGQATLASYGVYPGLEIGSLEQRMTDIQAALCGVLPPAHWEFLNSLRPSVTIGDYMFVHAGVRPGVPLNLQRDSDLLWIRESFLGSSADHGKVIVHGHTIADQPEVRANRIGIDTGAYATNRLTCLVLEGTARRFLHT